MTGRKPAAKRAASSRPVPAAKPGAPEAGGIDAEVAGVTAEASAIAAEAAAVEKEKAEADADVEASKSKT